MSMTPGPPPLPPQSRPTSPVVLILAIAGALFLLVLGVISVLVTGGRSGYSDDEARDRREIERRANDGDLQAMIEAGDKWKEGLEDASDESKAIGRDYLKAREWYQKAVDKFGSAEAMDRIGQLYLRGGWGIRQDYATAREWFERGAAAGGTGAMNSLAAIYRDGTGVEADTQTSRQWEERARATAQKQYAGEEIPKLEKAAATGDVSAMNKLGTFYHDGNGVPKDYAKARDWWEKAAATGQKGSVWAMYSLGDLYMASGSGSGPGVQYDQAKALEWYHKAADAGSRDAMCMIADLSQNDPAKARLWSNRCHEVANGQAMH